MAFYIFHRHSVCLVDRVDLIYSLYSWWEVFGSSSLTTLALGFSCGFISISACGLSTGVCSWGCPGGLGSPPGRTRCGGGAAAWVVGVLAASGTLGSCWLGQQEIQCSRRVWQPVLANTFQYSCLEKPLSEKPGRSQSTGSQGVGHYQYDPTHIDARIILFVAALLQWVEHEVGAAAWFAATLALPSVQGHGLPPLQELWPYQSLFLSLL